MLLQKKKKIGVRYYFTTTRLQSNEQKITDIGEDVKKLETLYIAGKNVNGVAMWKSLVVPQKVTHRITL